MKRIKYKKIVKDRLNPHLLEGIGDDSILEDVYLKTSSRVQNRIFLNIGRLIEENMGGAHTGSAFIEYLPKGPRLIIMIASRTLGSATRRMGTTMQEALRGFLSTFVHSSQIRIDPSKD